MIYEIYINTTAVSGLLYIPEDPDHNLEACTVTKKVNSVDTLEFTINGKNVQYGNIKERQSKIVVYKDDEIFFTGLVMSVRETIRKTKKVTCRGYLGFLTDTIILPYTYRCETNTDTDHPQYAYMGQASGDFGSSSSFYTNTPIWYYIYDLVGVHNKRYDPSGSYGWDTWGKFRVNNNEQFYEPVGSYMYRASSIFPYCYNELMEKIVKSFGGFISCETAGTIHNKSVDVFNVSQDIHYTQYPRGKASGQVIRFGYNLLDLEKYIDTTNLVSCLIPLGAKIYENVEGDEARLTIASANSGKKWLENTSAVNKYGRIYAVERWDDVTLAGNLKTKGTARLNELINAQITFTISAVDLSNADVDVDSIECCDSATVEASELGISFLQVYCTAKTTDILNPANDKFTFGTAGSEQQVSMINKSVTTGQTTVETKNGLNGYVVKTGTSRISPTENTPTSINVTFDQVFLTIPKVIVTPVGTDIGTRLMGCSVSNVTKQGFKLWLYRTNTTATDIHWIAIGMGNEGVKSS